MICVGARFEVILKEGFVIANTPCTYAKKVCCNAFERLVVGII